MNPYLVERLRRNAPLVGAALALLVFLGVHLAVFGPTAARLQRATRRAEALGASMDPDRQPTLMPPRVVALVSENALPEAQALALGNSGELTADLLAEVTEIANRSGLDVMATEPGVAAQQGRAVHVRARVRARGSYVQLVRFLDALARGPRLISVDRFEMTAEQRGRQQIELWVTRYVIKRPGGRR